MSVFSALDSSAASRVFFVVSSTGAEVSSDILSLGRSSVQTDRSNCNVYATLRMFEGTTKRFRISSCRGSGKDGYQAPALMGQGSSFQHPEERLHVGVWNARRQHPPGQHHPGAAKLSAAIIVASIWLLRHYFYKHHQGVHLGIRRAWCQLCQGLQEWRPWVSRLSLEFRHTMA